jgi:hypothetical protein
VCSHFLLNKLEAPAHGAFRICLVLLQEHRADKLVDDFVILELGKLLNEEHVSESVLGVS